MTGSWRDLRGRLAADLEPRGLDLVAATSVPAYNAQVPADLALPDLGRPDALCLVVGNSRALWPALRAARRADPALAADPDPVDRYTARCLHEAAGALGPRVEVRCAFEPPPRRVAIQRLAHLAGLAHLGPAHLCVHPQHGPWVSLRGAVVVDAPGPAEVPPAPDPCTGCPAPCVDAVSRAVEATGDRPPKTAWRAWLAVRDACPEGRAARFDEDQIRYHYAQDPAALEARPGAAPPARERTP